MVSLVPLSPVSGPLCASLHSQGFPAGQQWDELFFTKLLALPTTRGQVAMLFDQPVGFVLWQHDADNAEIYTLVTHPDHRRKGYGRVLLSAAELALANDGITRIVLDVALDNPGAHQLYVQSGYAQIGQRKDYYRRADGLVDALVLQKVLETR